jgi:hypothetical protein
MPDALRAGFTRDVTAFAVLTLCGRSIFDGDKALEHF